MSGTERDEPGVPLVGRLGKDEERRQVHQGDGPDVAARQRDRGEGDRDEQHQCPSIWRQRHVINHASEKQEQEQYRQEIRQAGNQ